MKWFALWFACFIKGVNCSHFSWLCFVSLSSIVSSIYVNKRIIEYNIHFGKHFIQFCTDWYNIFSGVCSQLIKLWTYFTANILSHLTLSFLHKLLSGKILQWKLLHTYTNTYRSQKEMKLLHSLAWSIFLCLMKLYSILENWDRQHGHCNKIFTQWFEGWIKDTSTKTSALCVLKSLCKSVLLIVRTAKINSSNKWSLFPVRWGSTYPSVHSLGAR